LAAESSPRSRKKPLSGNRLAPAWGPIDVDRIEKRLMDPRFARVRQSLMEIGFTTGVDLLSTFAAQGPQLGSWLADAQINRDRNLRLQYLAGLGLNRYEQALIYSQIIANRHVPPDLFRGSPERLAAIRAAIMSRSCGPAAADRYRLLAGAPPKPKTL
jgi:hypothetical protein